MQGLGESGVALASRVSYAVVVGPIFAWRVGTGVSAETRLNEQVGSGSLDDG